MTDNESRIINNDSALPIPRQFARWLGWNEAGILQQLHWHTQEGHGQFIDGVHWIRMSETEWMDEIPLDEKAIQRAIKNLIADGLIRAKVFSGRCNWYTVAYEAVEALAGPVDRITQKSEKRKAARASRKDAKEQIVPIAIETTPPETVEAEPVETDAYANGKEQSVPIARWVQNGGIDRYNLSPGWVQNVPLQESLQESDKNLLLLNAPAHDEILLRIGNLCRTNFSNPEFDPFKSSLIEAINRYTASKVLWAIELALSPDKANGKPKTWGFVKAILEKDKDGSYEAQKKKNEVTRNGHYGKPAKQPTDHRPAFERDGPPTPEQIRAQLKSINAQ